MNVEKILQDPTKYYTKPQAVLDDSKLSKADKIKILESWAYDIQEINKAVEENMPGREYHKQFSDIHKALLKLKK